jgi:hypothetical protein
MADVDQKGMTTVRTQNNWDNKATQNVGDRNDATIWQDEVVVATAQLFGADEAMQNKLVRQQSDN